MKLSLSKWLFFLTCYIALLSPLYAAQDVWAVLREHFTLNHEENTPEVRAQLRWLLAHPYYFNYLSKSRPYIYHIINEVKKRKLPGELALIPMIESTYNPFAYSWKGAAGLWQLMPATSNDLGLKRDWWYDARRSLCPSTSAALNYFTQLHQYFNGNWLFAIAAYDAGSGTIKRAIKKTNQPEKNLKFWSLTVPSETKQYIPRLLALAAIIKNPAYYQIKLPFVPYSPYFKAVDVGSQIDLNRAAELAGISYQELLNLNPGYNRWATAPYKPYKLLIPIANINRFIQNLTKTPPESRTTWHRYQVRFADNLASIAKRHMTTVKLLREINQLASDKLQQGQSILIPSNKNVVLMNQLAASSLRPTPNSIPTLLMPERYKVIHIVQSNDTYKTLEKKYNISKKDIQEWNKYLQNLQVGQQLVIWRNSNQELKPLA